MRSPFRASIEKKSPAAVAIIALASCGIALVSCAEEESTTTDDATATKPPAAEDLGRDIVRTDLSLDLASLEGTAKITLAASKSKAASFEIGDLQITSVKDASGPLHYRTSKKGQLDVGVPTGKAKTELTVEYAFKPHDNYDGWNPDRGVSFLWPTLCGNLFPCRSTPTDGLRFTLSVTGVPAGQQAIYPKAISADAPSYMPAIAVGSYTKIDLGKTAKGTRVSAWHLPGQEAETAKGTAHLRDAFEFYEKTYGPYTFGADVGSVSADWGPGAFGGMEHHPYWHVAKEAMGDEETHAHEAAHGWFGNGVRIGCWEDFVLSEGTVTYLAARALEASGVDVWPGYACELQYDCDPNNGANTIALPSTCGAIDLLHDPLWSTVPYMKGAYFYREVEKLLGKATLDQIIAAFYQANVGKSAHMRDMIDAILAKAGKHATTIEGLVKTWLEAEACPIDVASLCP